jgi:hypothetical protein
VALLVLCVCARASCVTLAGPMGEYFGRYSEAVHGSVQSGKLPEKLTHSSLSFVSTGNLNWNPLNIKITDRRKLVEIQ